MPIQLNEIYAKLVSFTPSLANIIKPMKKISQIILLILLTINSVYSQEYERYKKLADTTIISKYLGYDKNITVTVPFEWQEDLNRDFPLIIVFDRQNRRSHNYILNTIDYLTSNEQMPSSIIISVGSERNRFVETWHKVSGETGLALENEKFIFDELIPLAETKYNASPFRLFIGHSRYGYFTTSLFHSKVNDLDAVISISPFFEQDNVDLTDSIGQLSNKLFNSKKYYRYGIGNDYPDDFHKMDSALKHLNNRNIDSKGYLFNEATHNATPGLIISTALYEIFEKWYEIQSKYFTDQQLDLTIINSLDEEVIEHYGSPLEFGIGVLNGKGWFFYNDGNYEKAIEAWEILLESYPNFSDAYLYIIEAKLKLGQDISKTTELFTNSLSTSKIYTEDQKEKLILELNNLIK